ncbi:hypothetical protein BJV74DRAFT_860245, partial [Russula compacta]
MGGSQWFQSFGMTARIMHPFLDRSGCFITAYHLLSLYFLRTSRSWVAFLVVPIGAFQVGSRITIKVLWAMWRRQRRKLHRSSHQ